VTIRGYAVFWSVATLALVAVARWLLHDFADYQADRRLIAERLGRYAYLHAD
jgi:hypothetical protein